MQAGSSLSMRGGADCVRGGCVGGSIVVVVVVVGGGGGCIYGNA